MCICENQLIGLDNIHYARRNIELNVMKDEVDPLGNEAYYNHIVLWEDHNAIAVFTIHYCPKCGRKLDE